MIFGGNFQPSARTLDQTLARILIPSSRGLAAPRGGSSDVALPETCRTRRRRSDIGRLHGPEVAFVIASLPVPPVHG